MDLAAQIAVVLRICFIEPKPPNWFYFQACYSKRLNDVSVQIWSVHDLHDD